MSNFQSFAEALEKKIRSEISEELEGNQPLRLEGEVVDSTGYQHLAWLMGQNPTLQRSFSYQNSSYSRLPRPAPRKRRPHIMNEIQTTSYAVLCSYSPSLSEGFNISELKRAYRQALLKVHPDMGGAPASFWQVQDAFAALKTLIERT